MDAAGAGFRRGKGGSGTGQFRIKGRRDSERYREERTVAVDNIPAHEDRNAQTRLFNRDPLELIEPDRVDLVQDGPDFPLPNGSRIGRDLASGGNLVHLADLFLQGHPGQ